MSELQNKKYASILNPKDFSTAGRGRCLNALREM